MNLYVVTFDFELDDGRRAGDVVWARGPFNAVRIAAMRGDHADYARELGRDNKAFPVACVRWADHGDATPPERARVCHDGRLVRRAGLVFEDAATCDSCGLGEDDAVPESAVCEMCLQCGECGCICAEDDADEATAEGGA